MKYKGKCDEFLAVKVIWACMKKIIAAMPLLLCLILVVVCIPFIAIGEGANFIANKIMPIGDKIIEWEEK